MENTIKLPFHPKRMSLIKKRIAPKGHPLKINNVNTNNSPTYSTFFIVTFTSWNEFVANFHDSLS